MSVVVKNLIKKYGNQIAVNDVSFTIHKGEIVGFLGPNGAGKSTTMKIITGFITADEGEVLVCNQKVSTGNLITKSKIGYLPEANPLYPEMYVKEYLEFIANIHRITNKRKAITNVIEVTGLFPEANKKIGQLSKGYKQRVGLAAALLHDPEVLILDEPTSGLDPNQIIEIRELIKNLGSDKIVLFSSHILQEVQAICKRIIIIDKGKIVADDQLNNLVHNNHYSGLTLKIKEVVKINIFDDIQNIKQINANTWEFKTDDADNLKRKLMQIALDKNLNIISLQSESTNDLENIFKKLTKKN